MPLAISVNGSASGSTFPAVGSGGLEAEFEEGEHDATAYRAYV